MQRRIGQPRQDVPLPSAVLVLSGLPILADPYIMAVRDIFEKQDALPWQYRFKSHPAGFQIHMGQKALPLSVQTTLFFAGIGTLFFHLCAKLKVPAFLGSSFAYLGGFAAVAELDSGIYASMSG